MKKYGILPGIILIGTGIYFFLNQLDSFNSNQFFSWPTYFLIIGFAFLLQGYIGKDAYSIFPGVLFAGFGVHFHGQTLFDFWPTHWGIYTLLLSMAFLFQHQELKRGILPGIIFLIISLFGIFETSISEYLTSLNVSINWFYSIWPLILITLGFYILFFKSK
ncbi:LiaI-LiaF-like domain-containing protein [Bacillus solimangrovi]|uniref:LiaI-LiaF-like transmembrane region domain-containing protein n=1 Tax=Bacillus solimangrovi TaxID=1305675 RepID=A0A1E5LBH0_9BACI|nr:DUF5668 domain-containing protein [Bacillus solimangrovi]OEH91433.1 hypothetical protein BFG57_04785 [Bacillus solimangrovi]